MLVLTRHLDEAIRIGDGVIIKVLSIDSNNVKIGIEAPKSVPVFREEIYQRIKEENLNASKIDYGNVKNMADILKDKVKDKTFPENSALFILDNDKNKNIILETFSENGVPVISFDLRMDEKLTLMSIPNFIILNVTDESSFNIFCNYINNFGIKTSVLALNIPSNFKYDEEIHKKINLSTNFSDWEQIRKQITNMLKLKIYPMESGKSLLILNNFPFSMSIANK